MKAPRAKSIAFTDDQLIDIVSWWLEPLKKGEHAASHEKILEQYAKKYKSIDPRYFEQAKWDAFRKGLVELHSNRPVQRVDLLKPLANELAAQYELSNAFVIDSEEPDSTTLHRQMGQALCEAMSSGLSFFPDKTIIGLGSGRAIHFFVDAFRHNTRKINVPNITLMSLTGTVYPEAPNQGQLFDADINTVEFARFFNQATTVRTVGHSIAHDDVPTVRRNTWLHDTDDDRFVPNRESEDLRIYEGNLYERHIPDMAIVGIGVLGPDHRLYREVSSNSARSSTMLNPIRQDMLELIKLSDVISERNKSRRNKSAPPYFACADICHRFFFIPPPSDVEVQSHEKAAIEKRIEAVNRHMLTVTKTQLSMCNNVILIAGGRDKVLAVRHLMRRNMAAHRKKQQPIVVDTLCTDRMTAEELLKK